MARMLSKAREAAASPAPASPSGGGFLPKPERLVSDPSGPRPSGSGGGVRSAPHNPLPRAR